MRQDGFLTDRTRMVELNRDLQGITDMTTSLLAVNSAAAIRYQNAEQNDNDSPDVRESGEKSVLLSDYMRASSQARNILAMKPITSIQALQAYSDIEVSKAQPNNLGAANILKVNKRYDKFARED